MGVQTDGQYQYFTEYNKQYMSPCPPVVLTVVSYILLVWVLLQFGTIFGSAVCWQQIKFRGQLQNCHVGCCMNFTLQFLVSIYKASPSSWAASEAGPGGGV